MKRLPKYCLKRLFSEGFEQFCEETELENQLQIVENKIIAFCFYKKFEYWAFVGYEEPFVNEFCAELLMAIHEIRKREILWNTLFKDVDTQALGWEFKEKTTTKKNLVLSDDNIEDINTETKKTGVDFGQLARVLNNFDKSTFLFTKYYERFYPLFSRWIDTENYEEEDKENIEVPPIESSQEDETLPKKEVKDAKTQTKKESNPVIEVQKKEVKVAETQTEKTNTELEKKKGLFEVVKSISEKTSKLQSKKTPFSRVLKTQSEQSTSKEKGKEKQKEQEFPKQSTSKVEPTQVFTKADYLKFEVEKLSTDQKDGKVSITITDDKKFDKKTKIVFIIFKFNIQKVFDKLDLAIDDKKRFIYVIKDWKERFKEYLSPTFSYPSDMTITPTFSYYFKINFLNQKYLISEKEWTFLAK